MLTTQESSKVAMDVLFSKEDVGELLEMAAINCVRSDNSAEFSGRKVSPIEVVPDGDGGYVVSVLVYKKEG